MDQDTATPGVQALQYTNPANMLNGGGIGSKETKLDLSAWEQSIICSSCHPGGSFTEKDRNGKRFSMMNPMVDGMTPYTMYVFEKYDANTGAPIHSVEPAPWSYPIWQGATALTVPQGTNPDTGLPMGGWGQPMTMTLPNGDAMPIVANQVMMPNVKEFDCLMCHSENYNNLLHSVMTYSGAHNASASFGANFMSFFTEAYDFMAPPYGPGLLSKGTAVPGMGSPVIYNASNLKGNPPSSSCQACHLPSKLKDIPDMFRDFLSSAPMTYTGSFGKSFTGLSFPAFDCNAPFGMTWDWQFGGPTGYGTSPVIYMDGTGLHSIDSVFTIMMPGNGTNKWPSAYGMSEYNGATAMSTPGFVGGGNPAGKGPIFYEATIGMGPYQDQMKLKKGIVPFPRAEWFKRGDVWINEYDVHKRLECAGCHMDSTTADSDSGKSTCDPGRGFDSASTIETSVGNNSQETVKMCDSCHETGKNRKGETIETFGAPNILGTHTAFRDADTNGVMTVKLVSGVETEVKGSHMELLDCTVCHIYRKQMAVRSLDGTTGNRYPNMIGFAAERGMLGMFTDQMPGMIPADTNEVEWKPLYIWQRNGDRSKTDAANWRRKLYTINYIDAILWNNEDPAYDANGDGVAGRAPEIHSAAEAAPTFNYDPYISREMKAGVNYGPAGFAPVPVGFGGPGDPWNGAYMSAYNPDGSFTGAWKYVGVYGGNIAFSTPEEISNYKAFRAATDAKWASAKLTFSGANFKVTHGIRPVSQAPVKGKACTDCHAVGAQFFDGEFDMLGTAIKTSAGGQFMQSPAVQFEVVGAKDDIATGAEMHLKNGKLVELEFDQLGNWDGTTFTPNPAGNFKKVMPIERGHALYFEEKAYTGADGTVYPTRAAWLDHLLNLTAEPVAELATVPGVLTPATATTPAFYTIPVGTAATFTTDVEPGFSYAWTITGQTTTGTGASFTYTPTTAAGFYVNLIVTNDVTGAKSLTRVLMKAEVVLSDAFGATASVVAGTTKKVQIALSGMPAHTGIQIVWGDGAQSNSYAQSASEFTPTHFYYKTAPVGGFTATVKLTNAGRVVAQKQVTGILAPPPVEP